MKTIETKKVASVNEAIEIINRLNYRNDTFEYRSYTCEDNADTDIKYRHFDGYKENGEPDGFSIIEIVVNGKLEVIRFFNHFRKITVDIKLGDFNPDYSRYDQVIDADTETNESTNGNNIEPATETLVITHKERSDGTPFVYYVNGVKTRKHDIEFYYANNPAYRGLIEVDYNVGRYYLPDIYNNKSKVVFKNWAATGKTIVTKAAADELGLRIGRKVSLNPALYLVEETVEENIEADPADYAVSQEALEVATNAEIEAMKVAREEKIKAAQKEVADYIAKIDEQEKQEKVAAFERELAEYYAERELANNEHAPEYKYYIKSRRPIAGAVPKGYISATEGEMKAYSLCTDGSVSRVPRKVVFGVAVYDHPLSDEQIINYDLHVDPRNPNLNTETQEDTSGEPDEPKFETGKTYYIKDGDSYYTLKVNDRTDKMLTGTTPHGTCKYHIHDTFRGEYIRTHLYDDCGNREMIWAANELTDPIIQERLDALIEYREFDKAREAIEKDCDRFERLRDRCKSGSPKRKEYNQLIDSFDTIIRAFGEKFIAAQDRYNKSLTLRTDEEITATQKAIDEHNADLDARGIKYFATVYYFPNGIEGEDMENFSKECTSLDEANAFVSQEDIDGVYVGGIYDAGWQITDRNHNLIADHNTGIKEETQMTIEIPAEGKHEFTIGDDNDDVFNLIPDVSELNDVEIDETSPANTLVADIEEDDVEELNPIVETKITKRSLDSVSLKLNGKRISLRSLEDALDAPRFTVINEYGKKFDCHSSAKDYYGFFGISPEEYTIHFNTLGELVKHYAFDNIVRDTASETPVDSALTADIAKYQAAFDEARQISIRAGSGFCKINGEQIWFNYGELRSISSDRYNGEITFNNGRKRFCYRGIVIKRADFLNRMNNEVITVDQKETFAEFCDDYQSPDTGYFKIRIFPKFANGTESSFHATANDFNHALELVELFKTLDLPFVGTIKRNTVCGEEYYRHNRDGSETVNPPQPKLPDNIKDSLQRGMKAALEQYRRCNLSHNQAGANRERECFLICKKALKEVA